MAYFRFRYSSIYDRGRSNPRISHGAGGHGFRCKPSVAQVNTSPFQGAPNGQQLCQPSVQKASPLPA